MPQAIVTKYHPPTDKRGARISARCQAKRLFFGYDYAKSADENHRDAMTELVTRLDWPGQWEGGAMPDMTGFCWVMMPTPARARMSDADRAAALFGDTVE